MPETNDVRVVVGVDRRVQATAGRVRRSTFYLPPIWGFFAMRRLQRNRYL